MSTIPLVMTPAGPVSTPPATLRQNLVNGVAQNVPDYTANLPGGLIEDIASTSTGALTANDQARVDAVNSVTPYGAHPFILAQQGIMLGIPKGTPTNTSVYVVFSGPVGYVIPAGFIVSDGTYQYVLQDGGVIQSTGASNALYAVANQSGSWSVPSNTVTQLITSLPSGVTLTVTNTQDGIPGSEAESVQSYRSRIMQANQVAGQGTPAYIATLLQEVPGVTPRLVTVLQNRFGWEVICGGGDPYAVAFAIYKGTLDLSTIVGSITASRNIFVTLTDSPNQYTITYVNPPRQTVAVTTLWNTNLPNFTAGAQVDQLGVLAIQNYINSIMVGQPINLYAMEAAFQQGVVSALPTSNLTRIVFTVAVDGIIVEPTTGTGIIPSDPESYFYIAPTDVSVSQG